MSRKKKKVDQKIFFLNSIAAWDWKTVETKYSASPRCGAPQRFMVLICKCYFHPGNDFKVSQSVNPFTLILNYFLKHTETKI